MLLNFFSLLIKFTRITIFNVLYHYTLDKQLNFDSFWCHLLLSAFFFSAGYFSVYCFFKMPFFVFVLYTISVKPAAVHILAKRAFVSADKTYDIECKSSGSKPAAVITWWRGTKQIKRPVRNVSILLRWNSESSLRDKHTLTF